MDASRLEEGVPETDHIARPADACFQLAFAVVRRKGVVPDSIIIMASGSVCQDMTTSILSQDPMVSRCHRYQLGGWSVQYPR